ncbi:hypothetical protein IFM89_010407 [Coptis chinensis]|uniref:Uncharacterized protein n=1 Tax=Coptis chinensis TaxID=261450 RepID=A0A835H4A2_9MAGN|nr:hypothetical protein IFM89_010407 [Coptis chinensis]
MAASTLSLGTLFPTHASLKLNSKNSSPSLYSKRTRRVHKSRAPRKFTIFAVTEGSARSSKSEEKIPSWALPDSDELPPWAQVEGQESLQQTYEIPFYVQLLASAITAIAAVRIPLFMSSSDPILRLLSHQFFRLLILTADRHSSGSNLFKQLTRQVKTKMGKTAIARLRAFIGAQL